MITRREWFKAFNYLARTFDDHYVTVDKKQVLKVRSGELAITIISVFSVRNPICARIYLVIYIVF